MRSTVGGIKRPKNEDLSNIVDQKREVIRIRQEPHDTGVSKKVIWIVGIPIPIAVCGLLFVLLWPR